eukprot:UN32404
MICHYTIISSGITKTECGCFKHITIYNCSIIYNFNRFETIKIFIVELPILAVCQQIRYFPRWSFYDSNTFQTVYSTTLIKPSSTIYSHTVFNTNKTPTILMYA